MGICRGRRVLSVRAERDKRAGDRRAKDRENGGQGERRTGGTEDRGRKKQARQEKQPDPQVRLCVCCMCSVVRVPKGGTGRHPRR